MVLQLDLNRGQRSWVFAWHNVPGSARSISRLVTRGGTRNRRTSPRPEQAATVAGGPAGRFPAGWPPWRQANAVGIPRRRKTRHHGERTGSWRRCPSYRPLRFSISFAHSARRSSTCFSSSSTDGDPGGRRVNSAPQVQKTRSVFQPHQRNTRQMSWPPRNRRNPRHRWTVAFQRANSCRLIGPARWRTESPALKPPAGSCQSPAWVRTPAFRPCCRRRS